MPRLFSAFVAKDVESILVGSAQYKDVVECRRSQL